MKLGEAVATAVEVTYSARAARDRAVKDKRELGPYDAALVDALTAERRAVSALDQAQKRSRHKKDHDC